MRIVSLALAIAGVLAATGVRADDLVAAPAPPTAAATADADAAPTGAAASDPALAAARERAEALAKERRYAEARALLEPWRDLADPDTDFELAYLGMSATLEGMAEADFARADLREVDAFAERAAAKGHGRALNLLYLMHGNGFGRPRDRAKAMDYLERAVAAGDPGAIINYASMLYQGGHGVAENRERACTMFTGVLDHPAAATVASYYLGLATLRGECGLEVDEGKGVDLIRRAAEGGVRDAEYDYGRALAAGFGIERDEVAAFDWFEKAAGHGHADALWRMGMAHVEGSGGREQDPVQAVAWFEKAVEAGSGSGLVSLAVMYATGDGVDKDTARAIELYRRAAAAGEAHAHRTLAMMAITGEGMPVDPVAAWVLYAQAVALGNPPEESLRARIEAKLDPAGQRDAEAQFARWQAARGDVDPAPVLRQKATGGKDGGR